MATADSPLLESHETSQGRKVVLGLGFALCRARSWLQLVAELALMMVGGGAVPVVSKPIPATGAWGVGQFYVIRAKLQLPRLQVHVQQNAIRVSRA
jgi:hypothetical protein